MTDQVASLNSEPVRFQIGEPGAPCQGRSTCTDTVIAQIVRHELRKTVSAAQVRAAAAPTKDPCLGLNPEEALRGLRNLGVRGYDAHVNATADDAIRATDGGVVLVAVGYNGFPTVAECETGGRTDMGFSGPHAISLWGRRLWTTAPANWPIGRPFLPGWRVWTRDPDHHAGATRPPYDRFRSSYLVRAMDDLIGNEGWQVRLILARDTATWFKGALGALDGVPDHAVTPAGYSFPTQDFGSAQAGDPPGWAPA